MSTFVNCSCKGEKNLEVKVETEMKMRKKEMTILAGNVESPESSDMAYISGDVSPPSSESSDTHESTEKNESSQSSESPRNESERESKTTQTQITPMTPVTQQERSNENEMKTRMELVNKHIQNAISLSDSGDSNHPHGVSYHCKENPNETKSSESNPNESSQSIESHAKQTQITQGANTQATSNDKDNARLLEKTHPNTNEDNTASCRNENEMKTITAQASLDKTLSLVNKHIQNAKISLSDMNDVSHLKHYLLSFLDISDIVKSIYLINKHWYLCVTLKNNNESNLLFWKNHLFDTFKNLSILRNVNAKNSVFYAKYGKSEWYKDFEYYDKNVAIMACEENNDKQEFDKLVFNMAFECFVLRNQCRIRQKYKEFDTPILHNPYFGQCANRPNFRVSQERDQYFMCDSGYYRDLTVWQSLTNEELCEFEEKGLLVKYYNITSILKVIDYVSLLVSKLGEMNDKGDEREKDEKRFLFGQLFSVFNWFNVITLNYHSSLVTNEFNHKTNITSFASGMMLKYLLLTFGNRLDKCDGMNGENYISNMGNNKDIEDGLSWHGFIFRLIFQCDIIMQGRTFPYDVTDYNDEKIDRSQCFKNESKDFSFELLHSRAMIRKILFNNDYTWENTLGIWRNSLLLEMYAFNNERFLNNVDLFDAYIGDKCLKLVNKRLSPFITGVASFIQGRMHHKTMILIDYLLFLKQFKQYPDLINDKTFEYSSLIFNSVTEWDSTHLYRMLKSDELSIDALTTLKGLRSIDKLGVSKIYPFLTIKKYIRTNKGRTSTMKFDC